MLLGLLAQPECRAATMLTQLAIDIPTVRRRWPELSDGESEANGGRKPFSPEIELSLRFAFERLSPIPRPTEFATEHLLLGLVTADHEVSEWLRQKGLDPDAVEAEIRKVYGHELEPIALDWEVAMGEAGDCLADACVENDTLESPSEEQVSQSADSISDGNDDEPSPGTCSAGAAREVEDITWPHAERGEYGLTAVLRVLDASANRAREGLRVIEDYVRFVLDDRHLTTLCKQLRHDLVEALSAVSPDRRLAARDTQADVGTDLDTVSEQTRSGPADVLAANFARLQESLRSLEEFSKVLDGRWGGRRWGGSCTATPGPAAEQSAQPANINLSAAFKQLRYRSYTLERSIDITWRSLARLATARLYVLIDGGPSAEEFERLATLLIAAGVDVLQLRDKRLDDRTLLDRARTLRRLTEGTKTLLIMNDRPDLAVLARADGVHLGQAEMSVKDARAIVGTEALIGVSAHSIEQARQAVLDGANYLGVGPTFPSATKRFSQYPGMELLRAVAAEIRLPAFAIGGICRENLPEVLAAGFTRIAVCGAIAETADPAAAARALAAALE